MKREFTYKAVHTHLAVEGEHLQDKFTIIIGGESFTYSTGIGYRVKKMFQDAVEFKKVMRMNPQKNPINLELYAIMVERVSKPKTPQIDEVLSCLIGDSQCVQESFEGFCSEFGYDEDSRAAFKVYEACVANKKKLEAIGIDTDEANELLNQYEG